MFDYDDDLDDYYNYGGEAEYGGDLSSSPTESWKPRDAVIAWRSTLSPAAAAAADTPYHRHRSRSVGAVK